MIFLWFELTSFTQSVPRPALCSDWLEVGTGRDASRPQVSWGCGRTPGGLSEGMPGGDHAVFSGQSSEAGGKIRGFQLKVLFSVSEWTQLSPEKQGDLGALWNDKGWFLQNSLKTPPWAIKPESRGKGGSSYVQFEFEGDNRCKGFKIKLSPHEQVHNPPQG